MRETRLWLWSLASAVVILALLAAHFTVMHYSPVFTGQSGEEARSLAALFERGRNTVQMIVYILFLATALYHGLYGLRGIILELPIPRAASRIVSPVVVIVGLAFFAYGAYVTYWTFALG